MRATASGMLSARILPNPSRRVIFIIMSEITRSSPHSKLDAAGVLGADNAPLIAFHGHGKVPAELDAVHSHAVDQV